MFDRKKYMKAYRKKYRKEHKEKILEYNRKWIKKNRFKCIESLRKYRDKLKVDVFMHYSGGTPKCKVCNFGDLRALTIDHINDDGCKHRKSLSKRGYGNQAGGSRTYQYLKNNNYPKGYQVLCANCNMIKEYVRRKRERL